MSVAHITYDASNKAVRSGGGSGNAGVTRTRTRTPWTMVTPAPAWPANPLPDLTERQHNLTASRTEQRKHIYANDKGTPAQQTSNQQPTERNRDALYSLLPGKGNTYKPVQ